VKRTAIPLVLLLLSAGAAEARIQGAKGRRLQVFHDLEPYRGGLVLLEEPDVLPVREKKTVRNQHVTWMAHEFLQTRLRELPWTVEPWYDEFGPLAMEGSQRRALVVDTTVFVQGRRLALEAFLRDLESGRVVARFQGYGRRLIRSAWPGARDDLQEISRVLVAYLAEELKVSRPRWNGYEPEPYRRRDRQENRYRILLVDKDRDLPRAVKHHDPPLNDEVREEREPLEVELVE
jgi:hypothetical protein